VYYGRPQLFITHEGDNGESRRGVEGIAARTKSIGSSYPGDWGVGSARSHWGYPAECDEGQANGFISGAQEDGRGAEGAVGKSKGSEGIHARAYYEPSSTEEDRRSAARTLGQGEGAAEEGGVLAGQVDCTMPVDSISLSDRWRFPTAMILAMAADAVQIVVLPFFAEGALSPADDVLDLAVAVILVRLLGWHWEFLPAFIGEIVPGVDLVPFWTFAVMNVYRKWKQRAVPVKRTHNESQIIEGEYKSS
jgi:hypothetical protein